MVRVQGPILTVSEVEGLLAGCIAMHETLSGKASLDCMEPNLSVVMEIVGSSGHIRLTVEITPDNVSEEHKYCEEIDQSFLPAIIDGCQGVLQRYPKRGGQPE